MRPGWPDEQNKSGGRRWAYCFNGVKMSDKTRPNIVLREGDEMKRCQTTTTVPIVPGVGRIMQKVVPGVPVCSESYVSSELQTDRQTGHQSNVGHVLRARHGSRTETYGRRHLGTDNSCCSPIRKMAATHQHLHSPGDVARRRIGRVMKGHAWRRLTDAVCKGMRPRVDCQELGSHTGFPSALVVNSDSPTLTAQTRFLRVDCSELRFRTGFPPRSLLTLTAPRSAYSARCHFPT